MLRPPRTKVQIGQPLNKISRTVDKSPLLVADRLQRLYTGHGAVVMTAVTPGEKKKRNGAQFSGTYTISGRNCKRAGIAQDLSAREHNKALM